MMEMVGDNPTDKRRRTGRPKGMRKSQATDLHKRIIECGENATGMSRREIADEVGCDQRTVAKVLDKYGIKQDEVEVYKKNRADIFAGLQEKIVASMSGTDLEKVPFRDKTIALGVIGDKERLERGESTSNLAGIVKVLRAADSSDKTHQATDNQ